MTDRESLPEAQYAAGSALVEAAKRVVDYYPTVAGTSIIIQQANRHVPRNPWDDLADAIYDLSRALEALRESA